MSNLRHRYIVGIDFGTTFTGISHVNSTKTSIEDIQVLRNWPGPSKEYDEVWKAASKIAYHEDNKDGKSDQSFPKGCESVWGFNVTPAMVSCSWFKLKLDSETLGTKYDVESAKSDATEQSMLRLPRGKSPVDVCADYLAGVHDYTMSELNRLWGASIMAATPIDFWLTVPAVWSDKARSDTRRAARRAGFGARAGDRLTLVSEPEAAAISAFSSLVGQGVTNQLTAGDGVLICDCGGGTVDITTYLIKSVAPKLTFEELAVGVGGKAGSTFIDTEFRLWLSRTFGNNFDELDCKRTGPGSRLMKAFESLKRDFGSHTFQDEYEVPLSMANVSECKNYDEEERMVKFTRKDMADFFTPSLIAIEKLLDDQLAAANADMKSRRKRVGTIILVGGFGDSKYLNDQLQGYCKLRGDVRLICPPNPQAAIVKGAALRGLSGIQPARRRCRRFYGFCVGMPFRLGLDPHERLYQCKWQMQPMCKGRMAWAMAKGDYVDENTSFSSMNIIKTYFAKDSKKFTMQLYSFSGDKAPDYSEKPGKLTRMLPAYV